MLIAGTPQFLLFCLILMRMSGFIFLNPVLGRRNMPALFRTGLVLTLTWIIYTVESTLEITLPQSVYPVEFGLLLLKEFAVGYILGFVMVLFDYVMTNAGSVIDFQMGLAMATVYDPQNGTQTAVTGKVLETYFLLLFFAVDGHLALIKILLTSSELVPYGAAALGQLQANALVTLFTECTALSVKLAFPVIAIEFLTEIAVGMLIKIIPQINLFVLNIELKVVVGILVLLLLISPVGEYIGTLISQMITEIQEILAITAAA
ncbi:flagellar biosynthetic protein FliR [Mediterraneibacter sp. NSJ-55]|uniref:Flagellar biosynthetic protein FliR n=1 Tax=Mediterraneibacter hominis TaxID=2763054 RepID=A0A923LJR3_9FIRM|nr:flagellar biosynthetic protein FliR [Mediterraneibacter hominis]MBC5689352.1 flagellar biosynthetic protein FliR [Mediterraneibacter hominis]